MNTSLSLDEAQRFIEQERNAENAAIPFIYGTNFSDSLRINGIETEMEVDGKKIAAHRIYGTWDTFLRAIGEVTGQVSTVTTKTGKVKEKPVVKRPTILTALAAQLMKKMSEWITTSYTDAYKSITTDAEKEWLTTVIRFVVYGRIMENKYSRWIAEGGGFADASVAIRMAEVYRFRYEMPCLARLIHEKLLVHADRDADDRDRKVAEDIIAGLFDRLRVDRLRTLPPVSPDMVKRITDGEEDV